MRLPALLISMTAGSAMAAPNVMTDIGPVQGIVAAVMGDLGMPQVLIPAGIDAHHYTMRPSDAARLSTADVVFWIGEGMTPWLGKPVATLGSEAVVLELLETSGWTPRDADAAHHDNHDHDKREEDGAHDHDEHDHGDHDEHEVHGEDDHAGHDHRGTDPHAWLDPAIAAVWAGHIAETLADVDPENADTYANNAAEFAASLDTLNAQIRAELAPYDGSPVIWPHDAYGYFADAFGIESAGSVADTGAREPGPAHIAELQEVLRHDGVKCVMSDQEMGPKWANLVRDGSDAGTAHIDTLGGSATAGPGHYAEMMLTLARSIASCQSGANN